MTRDALVLQTAQGEQRFAISDIRTVDVMGHALQRGALIGAGVFLGLNALAGTIYPTYMRATGAGWALGIGRIGAIAGPVLGGNLLALGMARPSILTLTAIPFIFCALALFALPSAKRSSDARNQEDAGLAKAGFAH